MRRNYIILPLMALTGLLAACQSIQPLSIDYMLPAEASFPATLRSVAVVNNMPSAFGTGLVPADNDTLPAPDEIARKSEVHTGNAAIATEALAEALAEGNYFDQVIICDSALRAHDTVPRESTLSTEEADGLIRDLKADFLIAVEDVQLRSTTRLHYIPEIPLHYGTVDVKTYTTCRIYLPGRQGPAGTIHCSGPDTVVLEISATPYIFTFKLWDWGRVGLDGLPRPVHIDHGEKNIRMDRTTAYVLEHQVDRADAPHENLSSQPGVTEERTGLHELEFIETRRHWFSDSATLVTHESVNMLNLVEGESVTVESLDGSFEPYVIHYGETFIVPECVGDYVLRNAGNPGSKVGVIQAFVRIP